MSLLVIGSLALDTIETPYGKAEYTLGGSATFISTTASYFLNGVRLVGIVGTDFPAAEIEFLKSKGIDLSGLEISKTKKTFHWHGRYHTDMNNRDSITTQLNAFEDFNPVIPDKFRGTEFVCLGNVNPEIQKNVITQLSSPKFIMIDTMNFWIEGKPDALKETMKLVDMMVINDSEAKMLAEENNLLLAAKRIFTMGPKMLIIKKGEHGAMLVTKDMLFSVPAFPLEQVFDPTGAGDTFAGGFMGWLAKTKDISPANLKLAIVYGSVMASLAVEKFSLDGIRDLSKERIMKRFEEFRNLTHFDTVSL